MSKKKENERLLEAGETFKANDSANLPTRLTAPMPLKLTSKLPNLKSYLCKLEENKRVRSSILNRVGSNNELLSTDSKYILSRENHTENEMKKKSLEISSSLESFYKKTEETRKLLRTISEESSVSQFKINPPAKEKKRKVKAIPKNDSRFSDNNKEIRRIKKSIDPINRVISNNKHSNIDFEYNLHQQSEFGMREKNLKMSPSLENFCKKTEETRKLLRTISEESSISKFQINPPKKEKKRKVKAIPKNDSRFSDSSKDICRKNKSVEHGDNWKLIKVVKKKYKDGTKRKEIVIEEDKLSFELESLDSDEDFTPRYSRSELLKRDKLSRLVTWIDEEVKRVEKYKGQVSVVAKLMEKQINMRLREQEQLEDFLTEMKKQKNKFANEMGKLLYKEKCIAMKQGFKEKKVDSCKSSHCCKHTNFKSTLFELIGAGLMTAAAYAFNFI